MIAIIAAAAVLLIAVIVVVGKMKMERMKLDAAEASRVASEEKARSQAQAAADATSAAIEKEEIAIDMANDSEIADPKKAARAKKKAEKAAALLGETVRCRGGGRGATPPPTPHTTRDPHRP